MYILYVYIIYYMYILYYITLYVYMYILIKEKNIFTLFK